MIQRIMTEEDFKTFVNKESFERMVQSWRNHFINDDLTSQGIRKYKLMKVLQDWKLSGYNDYRFRMVELNYEYCMLCKDDLTNFFDIE